jgi:hypothetical protein
MFMLRSFIAAVYLFITGLLVAQPVEKCATPFLEKEMEKIYPGYLAAVKDAFIAAKKNAQHHTSARAGIIDTIYRIRTVVHVVYTKPEENLHDSIILSQIEVLNEDFRRRNPDASKTRAIFQDFAADAGIEFFLATEDPNGNPTTGITHTPGNPPPNFFGGFSVNDEVKQTSKGGVDPWPTDRYFNIWVCNLLGGLGVLGYAYPPAAPLPNWGNQNPNADSAKQGVVLFYKAVGRNNPYAIGTTTDGGRSATHEIGHYLGLRHIWGDDHSLFGPSNKCAGDPGGGSDGIDDTPDATDASQQSCDTSLNTCPDPNLDRDYPDMIENYMDYSSDDCLNMFTHGQVALMREVIKLYRPNIAEKVPNQFSAVNNDWHTANIQVQPQPATDFVYLQWQAARTLPANMYIFSLDGKLLRSAILNSSAEKIFVGDLKSGIYLLSINANNFRVVKRILVAEH